MKNLIYSFFLVAISGFFLFSCSSPRIVTSSDFSKRKFTKGRYVSFKNHFSSSAFSMENPTQKREGLITHAEAMKVTDVDYQAVLKNNDEIQKSSIRKIIKELNKQEEKQLSTYNENPNKDSVEIITTTGRVYRGVVVKSDYDGYFVKLSSDREIYISNNEIKRLTVISSTPSVEDNKTPTTKPSTQNYYEDESVADSNYTDETTYVEQKTEPMAILSLIFGILGFFPIPLIGGLGCIAAYVLGKNSIKKIDRNPKKFKGRGMALAGKILGTIGITLMIIGLIILLLLLALLI